MVDKSKVSRFVINKLNVCILWLFEVKNCAPEIKNTPEINKQLFILYKQFEKDRWEVTEHLCSLKGMSPLPVHNL